MNLGCQNALIIRMRDYFTLDKNSNYMPIALQMVSIFYCLLLIANINSENFNIFVVAMASAERSCRFFD